MSSYAAPSTTNGIRRSLPALPALTPVSFTVEGIHLVGAAMCLPSLILHLTVTGEFATQTCFQGRFGEEIGSDEFGSGILIHAPEPDKQWAIGRFSHIEVTHAGMSL